MKIFLSILLVAFSAFAAPESSKIKLTLNWKAEPEFGGFYTADHMGFFKQEGLNVVVQEGGVGAPVVDMVAAGSTDFGIVNADDLVINRDRGTDLVALFAVYQKSPKAFMAQKARGAKSIADAWNSGTIAAQKGSPHFAFLEKKLGKPKAKVVPQLGGISQVTGDKMMLQECFATSEPVFAIKSGVLVDTFPIANEGYNPYYTVVVASQKFIKKNPDVVKKFMKAVKQGWEVYLADPKPTNAVMQKINPTFTVDALNEIAEVQKPFIEGAALGTMEAKRFAELAQQLKGLGLIKKPLPGASYIR